MRNILLVFVKLLLATGVLAQSYFAISIGRDHAQYRELKDDYKNYQYFGIEDHGYAAKSSFYSISGEKNISKNLALNLNLSFTKKDINANIENIIKVCGIRFNSFRSTLSLKWYPNEYWYAGGGLAMHYLSNVREYNIYGNEELLYLETHKKFGAVIYAGATFKNFFFEPYLVQGFWTFKKANTSDFRPINSFGISLGYRVRVSKKK